MDNKELLEEWERSQPKVPEYYQRAAGIAKSIYLRDIAEKDAKIKAQAEQIEKLKGLLKETFIQSAIYTSLSDDDIETDNVMKIEDAKVQAWEAWEELCKQNGI